MVDHLISFAPAAVPVESPPLVYVSSLAVQDNSGGRGDLPAAEAGAPLQLMPEIHGQPAKYTPNDGLNNKPASGEPEAAARAEKIPLPTPRPKDLGNVTDAKALCEKTLHSIAAADTSTLASPSREAQAVVKQFLAEKAQAADKDRSGVLKKFGPSFDKAIIAADTAYSRVESVSEPAIKTAKEKYVQVNSVYNQTFQDTVNIAKRLPDPAKHSAAMLLAQVGIGGAKMPPKAELEKVFKGQPKFLEDLLQLTESQNAVFAASERLDAANKPLLDAALEQDRTRLAYERSAQSVGNHSLAKSIDSERRLLAQQTKELTDTPDQVLPITKI